MKSLIISTTMIFLLAISGMNYAESTTASSSQSTKKELKKNTPKNTKKDKKESKETKEAKSVLNPQSVEIVDSPREKR